MKNSTTVPHVVYIITKLELGGAQKVCLALMEHFQAHYSSATLISGTQGPLVQETKKFASTYLLPSFEREIGFSIFFNDIMSFISIIRILRTLKKKYPNIVVHTHSTKAGLLGRWAALCAGISHRIHTIHGYGFHNYQSRFTWWVIYVLEYITSLITSHFVCVSEEDRTTGVRLFPAFASKSSIIRAAVDLSLFVPSPSTTINKLHNPHKDFVIGTIACFKPQKNLFDLLRAFEVTIEMMPASIKKNLYLDIIGDGAERAAIESWILKKQLSTHIRLVGWQHDIRPWLHSWKIFALSSLWEGLPCSIIEARSAHLPIVAYNVGGIKEVVHHQHNGYLIEPGDWHLLAHDLAKLITDQDLLQKMSNYDDSLLDYSIQTMNKNHTDLYQKLANRTF